MTDQEQQREYRTVSFLVTTLANICTASPNQIIDKLTGFLWDEEEAGNIKAANMPVAEDHTEQHCLHCGTPTMHLGKICFGCSKAREASHNA